MSDDSSCLRPEMTQALLCLAQYHTALAARNTAAENLRLAGYALAGAHRGLSRPEQAMLAQAIEANRSWTPLGTGVRPPTPRYMVTGATPAVPPTQAPPRDAPLPPDLEALLSGAAISDPRDPTDPEGR